MMSAEMLLAAEDREVLAMLRRAASLHLDDETLARFADDEAGPLAKAHLRTCESCRTRLEELQEPVPFTMPTPEQLLLIQRQLREIPSPVSVAARLAEWTTEANGLPEGAARRLITLIVDLLTTRNSFSEFARAAMEGSMDMRRRVLGFIASYQAAPKSLMLAPSGGHKSSTATLPYGGEPFSLDNGDTQGLAYLDDAGNPRMHLQRQVAPPQRLVELRFFDALEKTTRGKVHALLRIAR